MIFVCFICLLSVLQTMETTATTQKQNRLDSTMSSCNINNYNSFYAGHNKKLENTIIEMKRKLDAIEQELKNLTKKVEPTKIGKLHGLLVSLIDFRPDLVLVIIWATWVQFFFQFSTLSSCH